MKPIVLLVVVILAAVPLGAQCPQCYFYGGDFDPNNSNANGLNNNTYGGHPYGAATFQNFAVNQAIEVGGLFTNDFSTAQNLIAGYWEIRKGISEGNGGTLIASGNATGDYFSHTPTGRSGFGFAEYQNLVSGLNINLAAGTYWFAVVPQDPISYNSNTFGLNSVGTDIPNEQYWDSPFLGAHFTNANNEGVFPTFSSGLIPEIPQPSSVVLLGSGLMGAAAAARRRMIRQ